MPGGLVTRGSRKGGEGRLSCGAAPCVKTRKRMGGTTVAGWHRAGAQGQAEVTGGGAPTGKAKTPPDRSARYPPANSAGCSAGRKCPSAPKLTAKPNAPAKGRARTSARTHVASRCARRACASMPALKSTPMTGPWHTDSRTRMPAPVPHHTSRPRPNRPSVRNAPAVACSHPSGGAERRVVELGGKQVVAALDRGQPLHRQFTHRRALRREHRPRGLPRCQASRQPPGPPTAPRARRAAPCVSNEASPQRAPTRLMARQSDRPPEHRRRARTAVRRGGGWYGASGQGVPRERDLQRMAGPERARRAGDSRVNRYIQTSIVCRACWVASWIAGIRNLRSVSAATHTSLGPEPAPSTERYASYNARPALPFA